MALNCIEKALRSFFASYGAFLARHPFPFLLLPLLVAGALGAGMVFLSEDQSVERLYTPENGRAKSDRNTVEALFTEHGENDTLVTRLSRLGRQGSVILRRTDGGNILSPSAMADIFSLHSQIVHIGVELEGETWNFDDICVQWEGSCNENAILAVYDYDASKVSTTSLRYPLHESDAEVHFLGSGLGGVELKQGSQGEVESAQAVELDYYLRFTEADDDRRSGLWEERFLEIVEGFSSSQVAAARQVSTTLETELDEASSGVIRDFSITFTVLITFSICSCAMLDWVRSKPWLVACGVLSAGLAVLSSFGLMSYLGVPYVNVVGSSPFLILGIGVDDMFIMLAAWRQTDVRGSVEERMRSAFSEAAVSITITSVTDALAFGIGAISPFKSVRIFCAYTGAAVLLDFAFQVTFFGACMVLTGRREAANRHCMSCLKVRPKAESQSNVYKIFCAGGWSRIHSDGRERGSTTSDHALMMFFKNHYGPFIAHGWVAVGVVVLYMGYLGAAIYGCTQVREGLSLRNLARDGSYAAAYLDEEASSFTKYGPAVWLVFTEERDVWNSAIQTLMEDTLSKMEDSRYVYGTSEQLTVSWLRDYLGFLDSVGLRQPTRSQFMEILRRDFLAVPAFKKYSQDIVFSDDGSRVLASRFLVTTKDIDSTEKERQMMTEMRQVADDSELPAIAYHPAFIFFDQYAVVLTNTLQNLGIAVAAMLVVALLLIPSPICALLVTLSLVSIVTGVVGLMTFWRVNLDSIAMINLVLCVGFSVDFSAHVCYAYISADAGSRHGNVSRALYALGMPILQGALSTILGVLVLAFTDSYIFRTFFKTMFLVISLGAIHGLVFLPVFLMLVIPTKSCNADIFEEDAEGQDSLSTTDTRAHQYWRDNVVLSDLRPATAAPYIISRRPLPPSQLDDIDAPWHPSLPNADNWDRLAYAGQLRIPRAWPLSS